MQVVNRLNVSFKLSLSNLLIFDIKEVDTVVDAACKIVFSVDCKNVNLQACFFPTISHVYQLFSVACDKLSHSPLAAAVFHSIFTSITTSSIENPASTDHYNSG